MVGFRVFDVGLLIVWLVWFFRLRDDDGTVLWPRPLEKPPESKRAPEPKRLEPTD